MRIDGQTQMVVKMVVRPIAKLSKEDLINLQRHGLNAATISADPSGLFFAYPSPDPRQGCDDVTTTTHLQPTGYAASAGKGGRGPVARPSTSGHAGISALMLVCELAGPDTFGLHQERTTTTLPDARPSPT